MKSLPVSLCLTAVLTLAGSVVLEGQVEPREMVTDSVIGTFVERLPNGFVLRNDEGEEMAMEIASDTIQELQELKSDTTANTAPHSGVMDSRDVLFILRQLEESEERDRMQVHYFTLADPGRRVVVWLSITADRVPGG